MSILSSPSLHHSVSRGHDSLAVLRRHRFQNLGVGQALGKQVDQQQDKGFLVQKENREITNFSSARYHMHILYKTNKTVSNIWTVYMIQDSDWDQPLLLPQGSDLPLCSTLTSQYWLLLWCEVPFFINIAPNFFPCSQEIIKQYTT